MFSIRPFSEKRPLDSRTIYQALFGEEAFGLQDDLLIGLDMLAFGQLVDDGIIDNRPFAREAELFHVFLKVVQGTVVHDDFLRLQGVGPAAAAGAGVLRAVHNHRATISFFVTFRQVLM